MKKTITLITICIFTFSSYAQMSFCDDFESYQSGDPIAQTSPSWNTWGELMTGANPSVDDANISTLQSSSGSNSLYFLGVGTAGGPEDVVLMFDTTQNITQATLGSLSTPYISGDVVFSSMMYIRTGAYLNFQSESMPGQVWSLEVNFDPALDPSDPGTITMGNTGFQVPFQGLYIPNTWFEFKFEIDLSNNVWELFIDGVSQGTFNNTINQIASLDLYTRAGDEYYVDDVCYSYAPATLDPINAQTYLISPVTGLTGQTRYPSVEVRNFGLDPIQSFDITFDYNGSQITENVSNIGSGFGLLSMQTTVVDFTNSITLGSGPINATAYVYNINNGTPQNTSDDTLTISTNAVTPAAGKLVIGEEATGTWCGWCPRGAVALNWMDHDYEGYWQGIAVHNGDPMTEAVYDNGIAGLISGYPSGIVDRGADINPANFKDDFLQRIVVEPKVMITNGAEYDGNTLRVSLKADFTNSMSNNVKIACVLVEDSVTGTGTGYYQSNSYSGGGSGSLIDVDGTDWANMPSNVPASFMVYRHVARAIYPSFDGGSFSSGLNYVAGDSDTMCLEFTIDPSWDTSNIHIVAMLIENGRVDNASSTSIHDAVTNGYLCNSTTPTSHSSIDLNGPDRINIFPNPASENIYISNLKEKARVKIYDISGKIVLENNISNKEYLNVSDLAKGVYQISFDGIDWKETRKLIIK